MSKEWLGQRYEDTKGYKVVIGYIDQPAIILRNPITGSTETVVIGCRHHHDMREISADDAISIAENHLLTAPTPDSRENG